MLVLTQSIVERELEKKYSIRRIRNNIDLIGITIIAIILIPNALLAKMDLLII